MRILTDKRILGVLRCPICNSGFEMIDTSLKCLGVRTHSYDLAASGYVNLCSPKQSGGGDSKAAVNARSSFLNKGHYLPVAKTLVDMVEKYADKGSVVIDAGCGEGYYGEAIARRGYSVFGVDLSKFAASAASKRFVRSGIENGFFATSSVFELPVADQCAGAVTSVFAPCAHTEFSRVLKDGGVLIAVYAGESHLLGLKSAIYEHTNINTERADLPVDMERLEDIRVKYTLTLTGNEDILSLFAMTPYYWRTSPADAEKLQGLGELTTEIDVMISVYKKGSTDKVGAES